jgi:hypothetical protein
MVDPLARKDPGMEQVKTLEELREMHGEELREYLVSLPAAERQRLSNELLKAKAEELGENSNEATPQ